MKATTCFPNFEYHASEVSKYICILKDFSLLLNNVNIVKFTPDNEYTFKAWVDGNGI